MNLNMTIVGNLLIYAKPAKANFRSINRDSSIGLDIGFLLKIMKVLLITHIFILSTKCAQN